MNIQVYYNFLTQQDWAYVVGKTTFGKDWYYGGFSNTSNTKFWYMDLMHDDFFNTYMFGLIESTTGQKFALDRVYANGQTHGLSGDLHQDVIDSDPRFKTFLYYANPDWNPVWGGYTVFSDKKNETIHSQYPTPNSAVLFDSNIWHAGLEPTRHCLELRVTVAFKMHLI